MPVFLQELIGFAAAFDAPRFETVGPIANNVRGHRRQQRIAPSLCRRVGQQHGQKVAERLQGSFETDLPRRFAGLKSRCRHDTTNQIVADQMHVEFVANAFGSLAPQMVHLQDDLDTFQVEFRLPPAAVQQSDLLGRILLGVQQRRHHDKRAGTHAFLRDTNPNLAQLQLFGQLGVLFGRHPFWSWRPGPRNQMIFFAQSLARAKVRGSALIFANHDVDAAFPEQRNIAPTAEIAVHQDNIAFRQHRIQSAKQSGFARLLPLVLSDRRLQYRMVTATLASLRWEYLERGFGDALAGDVRACEDSLALAQRAEADADLIRVIHALALMYGGQLREAIVELDRMARDRPDNLAVLAASLWANLFNGEVQKATDVAQKVSRLRTAAYPINNDYERLLIAHTQILGSNLSASISELDGIISRHPRWGIAYAIRAAAKTWLATTTQNMSDLDEARDDASLAARYHPDNAFILSICMEVYVTSIELARHKRANRPPRFKT